MPIYEYECRSCGVRFDRKQRWQDEPVKQCPECQGEVRKVIQPVGIVFKGPGFYKTDNSSSGERLERKRAEEGQASGSDTAVKTPAGVDSQSSANADSKPDSRSDAKSEPKADSQGDTKSDSKSGPKAESRAVSKPDTRPDTKSETKGHSTSGGSSQDH
jgi:putative FmdB family regulatory protein